MKVNKDLILEIPKKYEEALKRRFDLRRKRESATVPYYIPGECTFCEDYRSCSLCIFNGPGYQDCDDWIGKVAGSELANSAELTSNRVPIYNIENFKKLRKALKAHIRFV